MIMTITMQATMIQGRIAFGAMDICVLPTRPGGLEPPTTGLGNRCSIRLSYGRNPHLWYHQGCFRSCQNQLR